jgi:hypothetical protein
MIAAAKVAVWAAVCLLALLRPETGEHAWRRIENVASRLAQRQFLCAAAMALAVLLVRAALLPVWPIPKPVIYDEFGYLLQADTFASGRLTNPPHPLWPFFESIYILQQPTYTAQYPPGQGLVLAFGQFALGHAWYGVWLSAGLLIAVLIWALNGWLPPGWALLGGLFALPLCFSSYWMNSYWGGAVAAIGGALIMGAYPRIVRSGQAGSAWLLGLGLAILALTRQYEGLLFAVPFAIGLAMRTRSLRVWAPTAAVVAGALAFLLFYNVRVTGNALRLPYMEYDRQYAYVRHFNFLPLAPGKTYRHAAIFDLHHEWMFEKRQRARTWLMFPDRAKDWGVALRSLLGSSIPAAALLLLLPWTVRDRRVWLPLIATGLLVLGSLVEIVYYTHYASPAAAALFLLLVQSFRHLRQVRINGKPAGRFLSRAVPALVMLGWLGSTANGIWHHETPDQVQPVNSLRPKLESWVAAASPLRNVIIVRYTGHQMPHEEWVYNRADIDAQDVVWAHAMGAEENRKLVQYYKDRSIWLLEPDIDPNKVEPYQ